VGRVTGIVRTRHWKSGVQSALPRQRSMSRAAHACLDASREQPLKASQLRGGLRWGRGSMGSGDLFLYV
jgi:hypothetical protein